jgi:hypothetical protein
MGREHTPDTNDGNVVTVVVLPSTRLSEPSGPERLAGIDSKTKIFELSHTGYGVFYRDDDIVAVDAHPSPERHQVSPGQAAVELLFNPTENNGRKDHCLYWEAES